MTFFFGRAASLVEFTTHRGSGVALTLGRLVGGLLGGLGRGGLKLGGIGVAARLVKFGAAVREFVLVFGLRCRQLLLRACYRALGLGANLGYLGLQLLAHTRRFGDRVLGQRIGFFAFTLGGLFALVSLPGGALSGRAASLGLSHLRERVPVRIFNLGARSLDVAGRPQLDHQVIEVHAQVRHLLR
ncbi:hypothetical protein AN932_24560 [Mycobacterium intracellulare subsp. chimaera]|nr:hypothetical protein WU83_04140 [Mycobacterium nebraskense]KPN46106.1 hypothetical protein AN932_24560 [Mycobacterium intracellulare subsp. chimaera]ORV30909.1 hypothetical protein AWB97_15940 [Mycobacterium intracellulare subsp. chimaera]